MEMHARRRRALGVLACLALVAGLFVWGTSPSHAAPATHLSVVVSTGQIEVGDSVSITVTARDDSNAIDTSYRGTLHFTSTDPNATLPVDYVFTAGDNGQRTFPSEITLRTAGTQTVRVNDTAQPAVKGGSGSTHVTPNTPAGFTVGVSGQVTAGQTMSFSLNAVDRNGRVAPSYVGTVHFTSSDPSATLPADFTFQAADHGQHTFTNGATLRTTSGQKISAADTADQNIRGDSFPTLVIGAGVTHLGLNISDGITVGEQRGFTVSALDNSNAIDTSYRGTIHFSSTDAAATFPADYTFIATDNGSHFFPSNGGVTFKTAGTQSLRAADTSRTNLRGDSNPVTVSAAVTTVLNVSVSDTRMSVGQNSGFSVTAVNDNNRQIGGYRGTVHFTSSDSAAVLPADYTFTANDNGTHFFSTGVTYNTQGAQRITATDSANTVQGESNQSLIYGNVAKFLSISVSNGSYSGLSAGEQAGVYVTVLNDGGEVVQGYRGTVHFTSTDGSATLPADYTFTTNDNGAHFFSPGLTYSATGWQKVTAVDTTDNTLRGESNSSFVYPATPKQISVDVFDRSGTGTIGVGYQVQVRVLDENDPSGNAVAGYRGTVHFTSTDAAATLPADYTFTADDAGDHTFDASAFKFGTAGPQHITVTDTANGGVRGETADTYVYPAAPTYLSVASSTSSATAGTAYNVTVQARNTGDEIATGYRGTVTITSTDGAASMPASYTFTAADAGQHVFSVTNNTAGMQRIRFADSAAATVRGETNVRVGAGTGLQLTLFNFKTTSGVAENFSVRAINSTGGTDTGYTGTIHFTSTDSTAVLPPDYTFTPSDGGNKFFTGTPLTLKASGVQAVEVSDSSGRRGSATHYVAPATVTHFRLDAFGPVTAGDGTSTALYAMNDINQPVTYTGTVTFTSNDPSATVPPDYTFITSDHGSHCCPVVVFRTTGNHSLSVNDKSQTSLKGSSGSVYTYTTPTTNLAVAAIGDPVSSGQPVTVDVSAQNNAHNQDDTYRGTVHFTSTDPTAQLPADYTFVQADGGGHRFTFTPGTGGYRSITVQDTGAAAIRGISSGYRVYPRAATYFSVQPSTSVTSVGQPLTFTVRALNNGDIVDTGYVGKVHLTSSDPSATLPADYTFTSQDAGVHQFSVTPQTAGSRVVTVTDTANGNLRGHSTPFRVYPAAATHFLVDVFTNGNITTGHAATARVRAVNNGNVIDKGYRGTIHFTSTDPNAQLPADHPFTAGDAGDVTFTNGVTFGTGGGQSVSAVDTATSAIRGDSGPILVIYDGVTHFQVSLFNGSGTQGHTMDATVRALNDRGDVDTTYRGTIHFTSSDPAAAVPADYTFTSGDAGAKTFTAQTTFNTPGYRDLTAKDTTSNIQGSSSSVSVFPSAATHVQVVIGGAGTVNNGEARDLVLTAVNDRGDIDPAYRGTLQFTSTDAAATLPPNYTFTSGDGGTKRLVSAVAFATAGGQSVTGTDTANAVLRGFSNDVLVLNGPPPTTTSTTGASTTTTVPGTTTTNPGGSAVRFDVSMSNADVTAGRPVSVDLTARDSQGRVATTYAGTVHFTSTDANAVLPADYTFTAGDSGHHAFADGVRFGTPGNQHVTATDTVDHTVTGDGPTIFVVDPNASHFSVTFTRSTATSGDPLDLTITALNDRNDIDTGYRGTVHLASTDAAAVVPADYQFTTADAGNHTFSGGVTFKTAGNQRVTATDTVRTTVTGTSAAVAVAAAAPTHFDVTAPAAANGGQAFTIDVVGRDGAGNVATGYVGTVHLTSTDPAAQLPGDYTFNGGDAGRHSFSVILNTGGNQTVTFTDTATASVTGTSARIDVNPVTPSSTTTSTSTTTTAPPATTPSTDGGTTTTITPCSPPAVNVQPSSLNAGDQAMVTGCGFGGGQTLSLEFHSDPVFLGNTVSDAAGNYAMAVTIPADAPAGNHSIVVIGPDAQSISTQGQGSVFVQGPPTNTPAGPVFTSGGPTGGVAGGTAGSGGGSSSGASSGGASSSGFAGGGSSGSSSGGSSSLSSGGGSAGGGAGGSSQGAGANGTGANGGSNGTGNSGTSNGSSNQSALGHTGDSGRANRDIAGFNGLVPGRDSAFGFHVDKTTGDLHAAERAAEHNDRSVLSKSVRNPSEISHNLKTIAVNLVLAAGLILLIGFPSDLFNSTLAEHYDEIRGWFSWGHKPMAGFEREFDRFPVSVRLLFYGGVGALLYAFLDPHFGWNRHSLVTFLGLILALATISLVLDHMRSLYIGRTMGKNAELRAFPVGLIIAAILVVASRAAHFNPGYVFGVFTGLAFQEELADEDDGRALALGSIGVLVLAAVALFIRVPFDHWAARSNANFMVLVLDATLATLWLTGVQAIVWGLMPVRFLYGEKVEKWSFWGWLAIWGTGTFLFVHTLLQPQLGLYGTAPRTSLFSVLLLFLSFGAFSVAFWGFFRIRDGRRRDRNDDAAVPSYVPVYRDGDG